MSFIKLNGSILRCGESEYRIPVKVFRWFQWKETELVAKDWGSLTMGSQWFWADGRLCSRRAREWAKVRINHRLIQAGLRTDNWKEMP